MVGQSLLSGLVLFTSFAMRTPNDTSVPKDDYEITIGFKKDNMYFKRDWERELGQKYIDDEIWFTFEPNGIPLYMKPQYVNKTSRDLKYSKLDTRYKKDWFSLGHTALMSEDVTEQGLSVGIHNKWQINGRLEFESKFDGYYFRDEVLSRTTPLCHVFNFSGQGMVLSWNVAENSAYDQNIYFLELHLKFFFT